MTAQVTTDQTVWHTLAAPETFEKLSSGQQGLSEKEAHDRLERYGRNKLPEQSPPTWWGIFLRQFYSPLIFVLALAALVALLIGDFTDAGFIGAVLLINAVIGGYQEWRAEQSSRALQKMLHVRATVIRGGTTREIDSEEVVPGDVLLLESGNRVPADMRLLSAQTLQVDESFLTGESLAVTKQPGWIGQASEPVADHLNMAFAGAVVTRGRGKGVVVETGGRTVVGQLAEEVSSGHVGTAPLLQRMHGLARLIALVVVVVASLIGVAGVLIHGTEELTNIFMFTIALAVASIPEGLPAALTVALSVATSRMARRRVIVRRLAAVEGLGSCTMIASDKTGTLTCNELTVRVIVLADGTRLEVTGEGFVPEGEVQRDGQRIDVDQEDGAAQLALAGVLCNEADLYHHDDHWQWRGDPTDIALLALGEKLGIAREPRLREMPLYHEIPFEAEHRFAATYHRGNGGGRAFVKGATEQVLQMCDLSQDQVRALHAASEQLAVEGYRVLALAAGPVDDGVHDDHDGANPPSSLTMLGFIGMIDPLRPGVQDSIHACHGAGIRVCMITGDHPVTAKAIARQLGIAEDDTLAVTGGQLASMEVEQVAEVVRDATVFARVAPAQKLQLVKAAQAAGHFVAVTGDGVNDAPALRAANIGVAMGKAGTDVAREAAELVVSDDDFSSIVGGVEEGRVAYDNVRKVVAQLTATGAAEVMLVCLALAAGGAIAWFSTAGGDSPAILLPLLPVQLLWLNLVTNGIQGVALAMEPSEGDVLRRPPRPPQEPIFNRLMIERVLVASSVMALVTFGVFLWGWRQGWEMESIRNLLLLLMVLFENIHVGNNRSETKSAFAFSPLRSPYLLAGVAAALAIHVLAMYLPLLQNVLETEPVSVQGWATLFLLALSVLVAMEIHKWTWAKRHPESPWSSGQSSEASGS